MATKIRTRTSSAQLARAREIVKRNKKSQDSKWLESLSWSGEEFRAYFRSEMSHFNLTNSGKDLKPKVIEWMLENKYTQEQIRIFKKSKDWRCGPTMGGLAACLLRGMPPVHPEFNNGKNSSDWLRAEIDKVIHESFDDNEIETESKTKTDYNIQERIKEQAALMSEDIDLAIDEWIKNPESFDPNQYKIASVLRTKGAKSPHVRYIKSFYEKNYSDLLELSNGTGDDQLKENFKVYSRKNVKKLIQFYSSLITACDQISAEFKVIKKPRAKKVKPAEEIVKNLKFMLSDDKLGIASVSPSLLVKAQSAIVYNVRTRKLGYYISTSSDGFGVKGSSILNFSECSIQKTLRKPIDQLKEVKEQNTQRKFENWFKTKLTTLETPLSGRFSEDIIILKVFK